MAEPDAGERLDLEVEQRRPLRLREHAHLLLAERDVVDHLRRDALDACRDLLGAQPEAVGRPAVETVRVPPHGIVALGFDRRDDFVHDALDGIATIRVSMRLHGLLQGVQGSLFP